MSFTPSYRLSKGSNLIPPIKRLACISTSSQDSQGFSVFQKYLDKKITKVFYCRSPLENQKQEVYTNLIMQAAIGSEMMHHEIIVQVHEIAYFLIYYGNEGMIISCSMDFNELLNLRPDNKVRITKQGLGTVSDMVEALKKMKHTSEDYEPVLWNCQIFSRSLWGQIAN